MQAHTIVPERSDGSPVPSTFGWRSWASSPMTSRTDPRYDRGDGAIGPRTVSGSICSRDDSCPAARARAGAHSAAVPRVATSEPEPDVGVVPLGQYGNRHPDRAFLIVGGRLSLEYDRTTKRASTPHRASRSTGSLMFANWSSRCTPSHRRARMRTSNESRKRVAFAARLSRCRSFFRCPPSSMKR